MQARLAEAQASGGPLPRLIGGAVIIVVVWLLVLALLAVGLVVAFR